MLTEERKNYKIGLVCCFAFRVNVIVYYKLNMILSDIEISDNFYCMKTK